MPSKKATDSDGETAEGGKFLWEGPNDNKLLLITQGRYVKPDEYEQLASAFPGATVGSIRNRISALRVKQRNMYEERGWELPEGAAGHSTKKANATPSKRAVGEDGGEPETPTKKPRAPRKKKESKSATPKKSAEDDEEMVNGVKEEEPEEV